VPRAPEEFPFFRTYVRATADAADAPGTAAFEAAAARAQSSPNWGYREVATSHMVPANRPQELTKLLLEIA
jgi:carboxypeptidase C (cathepsin A)